MLNRERVYHGTLHELFPTSLLGLIATWEPLQLSDQVPQASIRPTSRVAVTLPTMSKTGGNLFPGERGESGVQAGAAYPNDWRGRIMLPCKLQHIIYAS